MQKATRQQTKEHNSRLVFKSIYDQAGVSRADIARATGLTKTTVSNIVGELMAEGLVEESGIGSSEGGKPPITLRILDEGRHFMGLDLAEGVFRGAIVNLRGEIKQRASKAVADGDGRAALEQVYALIEQLLAESRRAVSGIGVGAPGLMNPAEGVVRRAVNLDWRDLPLRDLLEERYNLPCYMANDCQAAALGEYTFGEHNNTSDLVVVKAGRGIGAGIVMDGSPYFGQGYGAGEIGHLGVVEDGEVCACGNRGCLETVASTEALVRKAAALGKNTFAKGEAKGGPDLEVILKAFQEGDGEIEALVMESGKHLGTGLASLVCVLNIKHLVIAGSMARFGEPLLAAAKGQMGNKAMSIMAEETEVSLSSLGEDIVIKGAASLAMTEEVGLV